MRTALNILTLVTLSVSAQNTLGQARVIIDAGHGYNVDCSRGDGRSFTEINTSFDVANRLYDSLNTTCGYQALLTRTHNGCGSQVSLVQRTLMANSWGGDVFLSIHCNALTATTTGTETFWCDLGAQPNAEDQFYASLVQIKMASYGQWLNRRVAEDHSYLGFHLSVLRNLDMHGALNEIGFVTSSDSVKLLSNTWRNVFKNAYVDAITSYLDVPCITESPLDCSNAPRLNCGTWYAGTASSDSSLVETYGCNNWSETGPERIHTISLDSTTDVTLSLKDYQGDLDVYIVSNCNPDECQGISYSQGAVANLPAGEYQVIVDADDGSGSAYDLAYFCGSQAEIMPTALNFTATIQENSDSLMIYSQFYNLGALPADSFWVKYYLSSDQIASSSDLLLDSVFVPVLNSTRQVDRSIFVNMNGIGPGSYWIIMFADAGNRVSEIEEFNNIISLPLNIIAPDITTSIASLVGAEKVELYPNPSNGKFNIQMHDKTMIPYEVVIIDQIGKKIVEQKINTPLESLDLTEFPSGVYELRIATPSYSEYKKLVITH